MSIERDIDHLIKLIASVAEAFTAALFLPAQRNKTLTLAACHSLSSHIRDDCTIEVGSGLVGWVAANGEAISVSDFKPETTTLGFYKVDEEIKSFLAVPVPMGDGCGVLAVDSKRSYVFPPRMQKLMTLFADHVGRWLHNSAVQALMVQNTSAIDHLLDVCDPLAQARNPAAVVEAAMACPLDLVGADGVAVALVDEGGGTCRVVRSDGETMPNCRELPVSLKQSLAGWVIRNGKALALTECREYYSKTFVFSPDEPYLGAQAFLGVPLEAGAAVLGAMVFIGRRQGAFKEAEVSTARLLATQVSTALRAAASERREWLLTYREPTTGLPNHRYLRKHGKALLDQATTDGQRVACLVMAIQELDALRLSAGRRAAEEALREVAAHCRRLIGDKDLVGRDAEGRFVLLCYRLNATHGRSLADKLISGLGQMAFTGPNQPFSIRGTVGLAIFPDHATDLDVLMSQAARNAMATGEGRHRARQQAASEEVLHGSP
ncbi:MAG: GAF domain-containing protein [Candidatus Tectimicrobiota bacterium]